MHPKRIFYRIGFSRLRIMSSNEGCSQSLWWATSTGGLCSMELLIFFVCELPHLCVCWSIQAFFRQSTENKRTHNGEVLVFHWRPTRCVFSVLFHYPHIKRCQEKQIGLQ
jgi:hypothetical protein